MITKKIAELIRNEINNLTAKWAEEIKKSEYMDHYANLDKEELFRRGEILYLNMVSWLEEGASNVEIEGYFQGVGIERIKEGFSLTEIIYAIYLLKIILIDFLAVNKELISSTDISGAFEMNTILNNYFDLGIFFVTRGYSQELFSRIEQTKKFSKDELNKIISKSALEEEDADSDEFIWRHV
jgi:hypothetical protein